MRHKIFFLFLLPLFYVVHAVRPYYRYLSAKEVFTMMGLYLLLTAVIFGITRLIIHNTRKAAFASFLLMVLFFFWGYVQIKVNTLVPGSFITRMRWLVPAWFVVLALLFIAFLRSKEAMQLRLFYYLNVLLAIYTVVDAGMIGYKVATDKNAHPVHMKVAAVTPANRLDVYFLLFDEYAGTKSLKGNMSYNNSAIDSFLKQKGFRVQYDSRSNYNVTPFSLTSTLDLDYLGLKKNIINIEDINDIVQRLAESATLHNFRDGGYDLVNASIFDFDHQPSIIHETFLPIKVKLITSNTFYDRVIKQALKKYGVGAQRRWINIETYDSYYDYNNRILKQVQDNLAKPHRDPQFVYAHFVMPHTPFYFDKEGNKEERALSFKKSEVMDSAYYLYNVQHTNKVMIPLVNDILKRKKGNVVIIVMGDHGFKRKVNIKDSSTLFQNMSAVYFPDRNYSGFYDSITNLNVFRLVNNKVLGTNYPLLRDSSILLKDDIK